MKTVFLMRHGECFDNKKGLIPRKNSGLTERGIREVRSVGKFLKFDGIELIISSGLRRSVQSARIIQKELKTKLVKSELLIDRILPESVLGKKENSPRVIKRLTILNLEKLDGEDFNTFSKRVNQALFFIGRRKENRILVITHAPLIKAITGLILNGKISEVSFKKIDKKYTTRSGGVIKSNLILRKKKITIGSPNFLDILRLRKK